ALEKAKNGADIPDKTAFYNNVTLRGTMGNGMVFASCDKPGDYIVAISDPNTVSDMPLYKEKKLYGYGVLHVSQHGNFVGQEYINHSGDCAWRQKWDDGIYAPWVVALSSSRVPTAADIGAITKTDADNHYVRQGSSGVVYKNDDLAWNSPTGAYLKDNGTHSSLIWHMGLNTGSASAAQFYFDFANSGLKYRSSRDNSGFEKPWARIYTDQDKPTAAEIGAYTKAETDTYIAAVAATANNATMAAADANANANARVPLVRKVNGKTLTADITLTADDIGAMPANSLGVKIWVSGEYTPATSTPIVVSHGLVNINPLYCRCDVLIKCITAEGEYSVGDFAINPMTLFMQQGVAHPYSLLPSLNTSTVQLNMMHYLAASFKTSTIGNQKLNMANWRCIFRIFY
ncbi:hypothetical protein ABRP60_13990, partial [Pectobacterium brasiliense]